VNLRQRRTEAVDAARRDDYQPIMKLVMALTDGKIRYQHGAVVTFDNDDLQQFFARGDVDKAEFDEFMQEVDRLRSQPVIVTPPIRRL